MRKICTLFFFMLAVRLLAQTPAPEPSRRLLVRFRDAVKVNVAADNLGGKAPRFNLHQADVLNARYGVLTIESLNAVVGSGSQVYAMSFPAGTDLAKATQEYEATGLFLYVEPDAIGSGAGTQAITPNDQYFARQWSFKNDGTFTLSPAKVGADIKMPDAWAIEQGDSSIVVGVIDSGCKLDHPEFAKRIWKNRLEIPGNGLDDDANGYVDDVQGWNFVSNTNNPADDYGHGTNVTGIIGATGNNGIGYAGVDWNCKLMICKGLDNTNRGFYSWWIAAIYYAVNNGAKVINMSMGGLSNSAAMQDAVNYAYARNVTIVASMMNDNTSVPYYPAALNHIVAVGSTNPNDMRTSPFFWSPTSGSSYGNHICVVAPGNYIYGLSYQSNTSWNTYWGGTSQAAPHVTGLASLLLAQLPGRTPTQIRQILQTTSDDQVGNPNEDARGWDQYYGFGRINAKRALETYILGSARAQSAPELLVFPNPASQQLTIKLINQSLLNKEVIIRNDVGQVVLKEVITSAEASLKLNLPPGLYMLSLPYKQALVTRKLLIH